ncbi:MAG: PorT family protein [Cytophagales bacterium]|nr:MAG: PorT family protein [Cytophagales bacterium]
MLKRFTQPIFYFVLCCFLWGGHSLIALGQYKVKQKPHDKSKVRQKTAFERSQWWLGIKIGGNYTQANPTTRYSLYANTATQATADAYDKKYQSFKRAAMQFGVITSYTFWKGLSVSVQPTFKRSRYIYETNFVWQATTGSDRLEMNQNHVQTCDYLEFPVLLRYDFFRENALKPFLQAGISYAFLLNAFKDVQISGTDFAAGNTAFSNASVNTNTFTLYNPSNFGVAVGGGICYDYGNARFVLECIYKIGLNNITNGAMRYTNNEMNGIADTFDDIKTNNLEISFGLQFPLKYLVTKLYKGVNP